MKRRGSSGFSQLDGFRPSPKDGLAEARPDVWLLIRDCWTEDPRERPNFVEICDRLSQRMDNSVRGSQDPTAVAESLGPGAGPQQEEEAAIQRQIDDLTAQLETLRSARTFFLSSRASMLSSHPCDFEHEEDDVHISEGMTHKATYRERYEELGGSGTPLMKMSGGLTGKKYHSSKS